MRTQNDQSNGKVTRILETANQFARQTGGVFVEVREKRDAFDARERKLSSTNSPR